MSPAPGVMSVQSLASVLVVWTTTISYNLILPPHPHYPGGCGNIGHVTKIEGWKDETYRSVTNVLWTGREDGGREGWRGMMWEEGRMEEGRRGIMERGKGEGVAGKE